MSTHRPSRPAGAPMRPGEHVVVIGFGPVAARFVDDVADLAAAGTIRLTVVGGEPDPAYNRVLVGEHAMGRAERATMGLADPESLARSGIDVLLGTQVTRIDRSRRILRLTDGPTGETRELGYDRLVLATGARPNLPVLRGINPDPNAYEHLPAGVTALRDLRDARAVREVVERRGRVVVLGGGVLGLEAALAAGEVGCPVTVVHHAPWVMTRSLDAAGGALLGRALADAGVGVVSGTPAREVLLDEDRRFRGLLLEDGREVPGELLLLSIGVTARTELAEGAGLRTARGVVVDHELEADVEQRVFAIGDCAEVLCQDPSCQVCPGREGMGPSGLVGPGWRQAEWLAARFRAELEAVAEGGTAVLAPLTGGPAGAVRLKAHQVELACAGAVGGLPWEIRADGGSVVQWADGGAGTYAKLVLGPDRTLEGYIVLGLPRAAAGIGLLHDRGETVPEDPSVLLRLDGPDAGGEESPMTPESTVCHCAGVTMGGITDAVGRGAATVEEVSCATRASTGCGGCKDAVRRLVEEHAAAV
ncbi:FAD-dependent oxidoreductase [uncultured Kocuria sp.]|uniref:FAD-dependent oxidoreductase n=1 Tax=uncultured Kocuria sp. TaxID=259305 RepID=UPI00262CA569|nr:FAD-dependent oxidoreductase [uncultured Kocuria sp.]